MRPTVARRGGQPSALDVHGGRSAGGAACGCRCRRAAGGDGRAAGLGGHEADAVRGTDQDPLHRGQCGGSAAAAVRVSAARWCPGQLGRPGGLPTARAGRSRRGAGGQRPRRRRGLPAEPGRGPDRQRPGRRGPSPGLQPAPGSRHGGGEHRRHGHRDTENGAAQLAGRHAAHRTGALASR